MEKNKLIHVWAAIIAGGRGTRLFPLSYDGCPKQFCQLDENNTFIQATIERLEQFGIPSKQIVIITTNEHQTRLANEQLRGRGIISTNIHQIDECFKYAGAMVKAAEFIKKYDEDAVIVNTPSDQFVNNLAEFNLTLETAIDEATGGHPVIVGVKTSDLVTAMGCGHAIFHPDSCIIESFIEKPNRKRADALIRQDNSACNTGINVWKASTILNAVSVDEIGTHGLETDDLMSKFATKKITVGKFEWYDCGTLQSIYDINRNKATANHRNVILGGGKDKVDRTNCHGSLFYTINGVELDATGLEDTAVIITNIDDRLFIAVIKLSDSQEVKRLAEHYSENKEILVNNFTLKGSNNIRMFSNFDEELYVGFVGVSNHIVYVHKDRNGDIRVAVSNQSKKN